MSIVGHNRAKWPTDGTITKLPYNQNYLPKSTALAKTPCQYLAMLKKKEATFYFSPTGLTTVKLLSGPWMNSAVRGMGT
jgi:hypothetical protein